MQPNLLLTNAIDFVEPRSSTTQFQIFFFPIFSFPLFLSSSFTIRSLQPLLREIIGRGDGDTLSEIMIARDHPIMVYIMRLVIVSRATAADQPIGLLVNRRMIISSRASVIPINSN